MPSLTVPDQSMSLRTLLDRHSRGMPFGVAQNAGVYDEEGDGVDFDSLDIVDKWAYIESKKQQYEEYERKYNEYRASQRQKEMEARNNKASNSSNETTPRAEANERKEATSETAS